jgi:hypothetical protein
MPKFKKGTSVNTNGYIRIKAGPQRDQYVHVMILEAKLGRKIRQGYTVHHENWNKLDNDPSNLSEITLKEHTALENKHRAASKPAIDFLIESGL